jgi:[ribosomal protein S5]-alanine N-acetyltransferase
MTNRSDQFLANFTFRTSRLFLRPTRLEETQELIDLRRNRQVASWLISQPEPGDSEVRRKLLDWDGGTVIQLTAFRETSSSILGAARIDHGELSYYIDPAHWGQGYGSELVHAVCARAGDLLRWDRLTAVVRRDNIASRRILEKTGFLFGGLEYWTGGYAVTNFWMDLKSGASGRPA